MKLIIELGGQCKTRIVFSRNWFTGRVTLDVDGTTISAVSPWDMSTHIALRLTTEYHITIGDPEPQRVVIVRRRPLLFAGFRPHSYRVYVDDALVQEQSGF